MCKAAFLHFSVYFMIPHVFFHSRGVFSINLQRKNDQNRIILIIVYSNIDILLAGTVNL